MTGLGRDVSDCLSERGNYVAKHAASADDRDVAGRHDPSEKGFEMRIGPISGRNQRRAAER